MDYIQKFKNYLLALKPAPSRITVKNYTIDVKHFISWSEQYFRQPFSPNDVSSETIETFRIEYGKQISSRSVERHLSSLRKFFQALKLEGTITHSPFEAAKSDSPIDPFQLKQFKDFLYVYNASNLTIKNYIIDVKQFIAWVQKIAQASEMSIEEVITYIDDTFLSQYKDTLLSEKVFSPTSINRKLSSLRKYLTWAGTQNIINNQTAFQNNPNTALHIVSAPISSLPKIEKFSHKNIMINEVTEHKKQYSSFPPLRLFQKISQPIVIGFDTVITAPFAHIFTWLHKAIWTFQGQQLFTKEKKTDLMRNISKATYAPLAISIKNFPWYKKIWHHTRYTRPNWYKAYHAYALAHYFNWAVLIIFTSALGFGFYNSFVSRPQLDPNKLLAATAPPRILSFQGRLTDTSNNPITTTTNLRFAIYTDVTASGSALQWQEVDGVTPDNNGVFSVILGKGTTIPQGLFANNSSLFLGISVGSTPELTPRQQLATVAYATNAETLQGLPPITQGGAGTNNVVLALNGNGNLSIGAASTFQTVGGAFTLSGDTLVLNTNAGTNGNIAIAPNGQGFIDLQRPLINTTNNNNIASAKGAVEVDNTFAVLATNSGIAAVTINQNGSGTIFTASSSGASKFTIANSGAITANNYTTAGGIIYTDVTGLLSQTTSGLTGQCLTSNGGTTPTWSSCSSGGAFWTLANGALYPVNTTLDLLIGSTATTSAKFSVLNMTGSGTPVASVSSGLNGTATFITADGTLQTANFQGLTVGGATTGNITLKPSNGNGTVTVAGTGLQTTSSSFNLFTNTATTLGLGTSGGTTTVNSALTITGNITPNGQFAGSLIPTSTSINLGSPSNNFGTVYATNLILPSSGGTGGYWQLNNGALSPTNITNDVLAGGTATTSAKFSVLNMTGSGTPVASVSSGLNGTATYITANGTLQTANFQGLTVGGATTGNITLTPLNGSGTITFTGYGAGIIHSNASGVLSSSPVALGGGATEISGFLPVGNGGLGGNVTPASGGEIVYSTSTTAYTHLAAGLTGQCLTSNGSLAPSWTSCASASSNFWTVANGALFPINSTLDLLVGGSATTSAKFAVLNMTGSGTPVASVSSGLNGVSAFLTATGNLATANMQSLTLGGTTTGAINIGTDATARSIGIGNSTGATSVTLTSGTGNITLNAGSNTINLNSPTIATNQTTVALLNSIATTVNFASAASTLTLGATTGITTFATPSIDDSSTGLTLFVTPTTVNFGTSSQTVNLKGNTTIGTSVSNTTTLNGLLSGAGVNNAVQPVGTGVTDLGSAAHNWGTVYASNFISPVSGGTSGFWQLTNSVLSPVNAWNDLAIGNNATGSATPWQVFATTVGVNTAGTATSSGNLSFRGTALGATTSLNLLNGNVLAVKTSVGGDAGLTTQLSLANNGDLTLSGTNIITTQSTVNLLNTTATTLNIGGGATSAVNIGNASGSNTFHGTIQLGDSQSNTINPKGLFSNDLIPDVDNTRSIGTTALRWKNLFLSGTLTLANLNLPVTGGVGGYWTLSTNVLYPTNNWNDLAIGGTATGSATPFQVYATSISGQSIVAGTATGSGNLAFRGGATRVDLLNNSSLGFYTSVGGNGGLSTIPSLFIANSGNSGNVGINTTNPASFPLQIAGNTGPNADITYNLGSTALRWNNLFLGGSYDGFWQRFNGAISPYNISDDFLLGATATTSAKFSVLNMTGSGTPVASVSSGLNGNGMYFDANGNIQTVRNQGLTIGGTSTGNITLKPLNGLAGAFTSSFGDFNPDVTDSRNLGTPSLEWNNLYVRQIITPASGGIAGFWQLNNGVLSPANLTNDVTVGGTATSSAKFQIFANTFDGAPAGTASTSGFLTFNGANALSQINLLNSTSLGFFNSTKDDSGILSTPALYVASSGNIGIETRNPLTALQVVGSASVSANLTLYGNLTAHTENILQGGSLGFYVSPGGDAGLPGASLPTLYLAGTNNGSATGMVGTVGIGTNAPLASTGLDIEKNAIGNTSFLINQLSLISTADLLAASSSGSTKFIITNSGTVGIGNGITDASLLANAGLDIQKNGLGNSVFNANQLGSGDILTASASGTTQLQLTNVGVLLVRSFHDLDNSNYFIDPAASGQALDIAGSAGIGTTSAQYKLDVYGDMRVGKDSTAWGANASGFTNRRQIQISNTSGQALISYQVKVVLDTATLITAGKMTSSSCNDIIFTDADGNTTLNYYLEPNTCNTNYTIFWVNVPSIPLPGKTIYTYYGKSGATSTSTTNTFISTISNLQGGYRMDESTNNFATDYSGNNNVGTSLNNGTKVVAGEFNNARSFNGTTDAIAASGSASLNFSASDMSIDFWANPGSSTQATNAEILSRANLSTGGGYTLESTGTGNTYTFFWSSGAAFICQAIGGGGGQWSAGLTLTNGVWSHVVVTYVNSTKVATMYLNGASVGTCTGGSTMATAVQDLFLGRGAGGGHFWNGSLDEVHLYNKALSSTDVTNLYGAGGNHLGYATPNNPNTVMIRNFVSTEPTAIIGQEQNSLQNIPSFYVQATTGNVSLGTLTTASTSALLTVAGDIKSGIYDPTAWSTNYPGWPYRERVIVDNTATSSALTNYQVQVILNTATLVSAGKMRSDCADARFSDTDGTVLNFWLDQGCNTSSTMFWVKVPSIPASAKKNIYLYYGNSSAATASNGTNTFIAFGDFSGTNPPPNWTVTTINSPVGAGVTGSTSVSGGQLILSNTNGSDVFGSTYQATQVGPTAAITGNFIAVTKITQLTNNNANSAGGIMVENSVAAATSNGEAMADVTESNGNEFKYQPDNTTIAPNKFANQGSGTFSTKYIQMVKFGTLIEGNQGTDEISWTSQTGFVSPTGISNTQFVNLIQQTHNSAATGTSTYSMFYVRAFSGQDPKITIDTEQDPSQVDPTLYVNNSFGRVGVGTANPTQNLELNVGSNATNNAGVLIDGTTSTAGDIGIQIQNTGTGGNNFFIDSTNNGSSYGGGILSIGVLNNGSGSIVKIDSTGKVTAGGGFNGACLASGNFASANTTGSCNRDVAEIYPSEEDVTSGDLLVINSSDSGKVKKSSIPYQSNLVGIVSTHPGLILGANGEEVQLAGTSSTYATSEAAIRNPAVALDGQVPIKVSTENGPINKGDYLTSSSLPGIAMKATKTGRVIGLTLENFNGATTSAQIQTLPSGQTVLVNKVLTFVNPTWYDPDVYLTDTGTFNIHPSLSGTDYAIDDANTNPITRMGAFLSLAVANLRVGQVNAQYVVTNSLAIATNNVSIAGVGLRDYIVGVVQTAIQNGTLSPIASVDKIHTNLISPLASDSIIAIDLTGSKFTIRNSASGSAVASIDNVGNATFSGSLNSKNLAVNNDATISGTLRAHRIEADEIAGLSETVGTLSAQNITNVTNIYFATPSAAPTGGNIATGFSGFSSSSSGSLNPSAGSGQAPYLGYANVASYSGFLAYVPNLSASTAMFDQGLISLGATSLSDTTITGQLSIGTSLILANNSINVLGSSFEIQPLRQGGVNFEGGLLAIDTNGNLTVNGNAVFSKNLAANVISPLSNDRDLTVKLGDNPTATGAALATANLSVQNASGSGIFTVDQLGNLIASGAANIAKLNLNLVQPALAVSDTEVVATGSAGTTIVKAHQTEITIDNAQVTDKSLIYITPVGQSAVTPYLLRQVAKQSFTVGIPLQQLQDTTFNWLLVN